MSCGANEFMTNEVLQNSFQRSGCIPFSCLIFFSFCALYVYSLKVYSSKFYHYKWTGPICGVVYVSTSKETFLSRIHISVFISITSEYSTRNTLAHMPYRGIQYQRHVQFLMFIVQGGYVIQVNYIVFTNLKLLVQTEKKQMT